MHVCLSVLPLIIPIGGGWSDAPEVALRATYDSEYVYLLARWMDDKESTTREPWVKQANGTWSVAHAKARPAAGTDWAAFMGSNFDEENADLAYEDKVAFIWNTYGESTIKDFDQGGCAVLCHDPAKDYKPGTTYNYTDENLAAKKYTNSPQEIGDTWHWKSVRQNHSKKIDDQYVMYWQQGGLDPASAGRKSDSGSGGMQPTRRPTAGPHIAAPASSHHRSISMTPRRSRSRMRSWPRYRQAP